jgi:hypothetical protein
MALTSGARREAALASVGRALAPVRSPTTKSATAHVAALAIASLATNRGGGVRRARQERCSFSNFTARIVPTRTRFARVVLTLVTIAFSQPPSWLLAVPSARAIARAPAAGL